MFFTSEEQPEGSQIAVRGDVNADGKANQVDLSYLIRYIIGISGNTLEGVYYEAGDFKKDGQVNQIDLTNIIRYIVYGEIDDENNPDVPPGPGEDEKDTTPPEELETRYSEQDWTNQNVIVTTKWQDKESGIQAYQIQLTPEAKEDGWYTVETTKLPLTLNATITENGTYYLFVKNADGTIIMKEIKVQNIDKTAPQVMVTQLPNTGTIQVEIVEEGSGITVRKYAKGEQTAEYFKSNGTEFTADVFHVTEDGTYTVYIQDRAGNITIKTITVTVTTLPTIEETQPPIGGSTPIKEDETTEIIVKPSTDVTIDPDKFLPVDQEGNPMDAILDVTIDADGNIHIAVTGGKDEGEVFVKVLPGGLIDSEGRPNEEFTIPTHVIIDNTKPSTQIITKPEEGTSIKNGDTISISIQPGETVTIDTEKIKVTGEGAEGTTVEVIQNPDGTITIVLIGGNGEGPIQIEIEEGAFTDGAGNPNNPIIIDGYRVDNTPPTITDFQIVPPTTSDSITVKVEAQDNNPNGLLVAGAYEYHISTNPDFTDAMVTKENTGNKTFTELQQNTMYYIKVVVTDEAGNQTESKTVMETTHQLPQGNTAIQFSNVNWKNETASITITKVGETDAYTVQYKIQDAQGTILQDWTNLEEHSKVIENLLSGYIIIAHVIDASGNTGSTTTAFIIDKTAPVVTLTEQATPTQNNVVVQVAVTENESGVAVKKYAQGSQTEEYFAENGTSFTADTFEATENGVWTVYVQDKAGNVTVETITVTKKDNEKPTIENVQLPSGSTTIREGDTIEIILTPSKPGVVIDPDKFKPVDEEGNEIEVGVSVTVDEDGNIHVKIVAGKEDGTITVEIEPGGITDPAGNQNEPVSIPTNITINNQKPAVHIQTPADKDVIKEEERTTVVIKPNVDGTTIDTEKIILGGEGVEGATIETTVNPDGTITIIITGGTGTGELDILLQPGAIIDSAGNENDRITLPITQIDNSGPNATLAVTNVTTSSITVKATATDVGAAGIATENAYTYTCSSDPNFGSGGEHNTGILQSNHAEATFSGLVPGTYYIKVEVKDAKGNIGVSNIVMQKTGDIPSSDTNIGFSAPIWNNGTATVTMTKTETVPSEFSLQYKIEKDGVIIQDWQIAPQDQTTLTGLESGTVITAWLVDSEGNHNGAKTISIIDKTAPTITLTEPSTPTNGNVTITVVVTDTESGVAVQKYAQGSQNVEYFEKEGTTFTGTTFEATENGVWTVYAEDVAGNKTINTITVTKQDKTKPTITDVKVPTTTQTIKQADTVTITITPSKTVTVNPNHFIPIDAEGNTIDATVKVTQNPDGTITVEITAGTDEADVYLKIEEGALTDATGNQNEERNINVNTKIDNTKPVITKEVVDKKPVIAEGATATITLDVSEIGTLEEEKITLAGPGSEGTSILVEQEEGKIIITVIGGDATGDIDIVLGEGTITDAVGNKSEAQIISAVVAVDNKGPIIHEIALVENTTSTIKIRVDAEDVGAAGLATDGTYTYMISSDPNFNPDATYEVTYKENIVEFTGLQAETTYYIQVIAIDELGNATTSEVKEIETAGLPTGDNSIAISEVTWSNRMGNVTITKDTQEANDYAIQYKIVNAEGMLVPDWTAVSGDTVEVENIENGSTVYARLYDGTSGGREKTKKIEDTTPPTFVSTPLITIDETTGMGITIYMEATDENGLSETEPYAIYYKKAGDADFKKHVITTEETKLDSLLEPETEYVLYLEAKDYFGNTRKTTEQTITTGDAVAKIDDTYYGTLQKAMEAVPEGYNKTIYLLKNVSEITSFATNKTAILDLNGKTVTGQIQVAGFLTIQNGTITREGYSAISVEEGGTVVLKESLVATTTGSNAPVVINRGIVTVEGSSISGNGAAVLNMPAGTLTINSGTVATNQAGIETISNSGTVNFVGGTLSANQAANGIVNSGTLNMTGGTIECASGSNAIRNEGVAKITGGTIHGSNDSVVIANHNELTIEGEEVLITGASNVIKNESTGTVYLKSGTVNVTGTDEGNVGIVNLGTTYISGGTYTGTYNCLFANEGTTEVTGGTLKAIGTSNIVLMLNQANGTMTLSGGNLVAGTAGMALQNNGIATITGTTKIEGEYGLIINSVATAELDITGGTITQTGTQEYVAVTNRGILRIRDVTAHASYTAIYNEKTATISGGTISSKNGNVIYTESGTTTITGGNFVQEGDAIAIHNKGNTEWSNATVSGSTTAIVNTSTLNIHSGNIHSNTGNAVYTTATGTTNIEGGTMQAVANPCVTNSGNTYITGADVSITSGGNALQNAENATMEVSAGDIRTTGSHAVYNSGNMIISGSTITGCDQYAAIVNGGTITTKGTMQASVSGAPSGMNEGTWYLQGGTLTTTNATTNYGFQNQGTMNMTGGTISSNSIPIVNAGEWNFSNGTLKSTGVGQAVSNLKNATFTVTGGSFQTQDNDQALIGTAGTVNIRTSITFAGGIVTVDEGGIANLISGTLTSTGNNQAIYVIDGTAKVTGATIRLTSTYNVMATEVNGMIELTTGTITSTGQGIANKGRLITNGNIQLSSAGTTIYNFETGVVEIDGGTISTSDSGTATIGNIGGTLTMKSGTVRNTSGGVAILNRSGTYNYIGGSVGQVQNE